MSQDPADSTLRSTRAGPNAVAIILGSLLTGAAAAALEGLHPPVGSALLLLMVASLLAVLAHADARTHRIPDTPTAAVAAAGAGWSLTTAVTAQHPAAVIGAAVAAAVLAGLYLAFGIAGAVGLGDVKLAGAVGLWVGALGGSVWVLVPLIAVTISGAHLLLRRARGKRGPVPHGPALALAGIAAALLVGSSGE